MKKYIFFFLIAVVSLSIGSNKIAAAECFDQDFGMGKKGEVVSRLHSLLDSNGYDGITDDEYVQSKFGSGTKVAVIALQQANSAKILKPIGLTKGTGFVGETTRRFLNELVGCANGSTQKNPVTTGRNASIEKVIEPVEKKNDASNSTSDTGAIATEISRKFFTKAGEYEWTVPAGVKYIQLKVWGGGGGGASGFKNKNSNKKYSGQNGRSSTPYQAYLKVLPGEKYYIHVGAGGDGGIRECNDTQLVKCAVLGRPGGNSWFTGEASMKGKSISGHRLEISNVYKDGTLPSGYTEEGAALVKSANAVLESPQAIFIASNGELGGEYEDAASRAVRDIPLRFGVTEKKWNETSNQSPNLLQGNFELNNLAALGRGGVGGYDQGGKGVDGAVVLDYGPSVDSVVTQHLGSSVSIKGRIAGSNKDFSSDHVFLEYGQNLEIKWNYNPSSMDCNYVEVYPDSAIDGKNIKISTVSGTKIINSKTFYKYTNNSRENRFELVCTPQVGAKLKSELIAYYGPKKDESLKEPIVNKTDKITKVIFNSVGKAKWVVPNGVSNIKISLWGAGGGGGSGERTKWDVFVPGAGGDSAVVTKKVKTGDAFDIYVGKGGVGGLVWSNPHGENGESSKVTYISSGVLNRIVAKGGGGSRVGLQDSGPVPNAGRPEFLMIDSELPWEPSVISKKVFAPALVLFGNVSANSNKPGNFENTLSGAGMGGDPGPRSNLPGKTGSDGAVIIEYGSDVEGGIKSELARRPNITFLGARPAGSSEEFKMDKVVMFYGKDIPERGLEIKWSAEPANVTCRASGEWGAAPGDGSRAVSGTEIFPLALLRDTPISGNNFSLYCKDSNGFGDLKSFTLFYHPKQPNFTLTAGTCNAGTADLAIEPLVFKSGKKPTYQVFVNDLLSDSLTVENKKILGGRTVGQTYTVKVKESSIADESTIVTKSVLLPKCDGVSDGSNNTSGGTSVAPIALSIDVRKNGSSGPYKSNAYLGPNDKAEVKWSVAGNAESCIATGAWQGAKAISGNTEVVGPFSGSTENALTLTCRKKESPDVSKTVNIKVAPQLPHIFSFSPAVLNKVAGTEVTLYGIGFSASGDENIVEITVPKGTVYATATYKNENEVSFVIPPQYAYAGNSISVSFSNDTYGFSNNVSIPVNSLNSSNIYNAFMYLLNTLSNVMVPW